jgi:hypothetical protein
LVNSIFLPFVLLQPGSAGVLPAAIDFLLNSPYDHHFLLT